MKLHPNVLLIYFDNKSNSHRKTRALAYSITSHVQEIDFDHYKLTKLMWGELLSLLKMSPKHIMNKAHPKYQSLIAKHDYEDDAWLEILVKNPELVKAPIVLYDGKAILCETPKDIFKVAEGEEIKATRLNI